MIGGPVGMWMGAIQISSLLQSARSIEPARTLRKRQLHQVGLRGRGSRRGWGRVVGAVVWMALGLRGVLRRLCLEHVSLPLLDQFAMQ
jgi:hypothetical protein